MSEELVVLGKRAYVMALQMLGREADALDVVQEGIVQALSHDSAPAAGEPGRSAWFFKVVRNRALDRLRHRSRFPEDSLESVPPLSDEPDPAQSLEQARNIARVRGALARLPLAQRELIMLRDYHNFSYAQIARILEIAPGTVMSRIHRARMALREILVLPAPAAAGKLNGEVENTDG